MNSDLVLVLPPGDKRRVDSREARGVLGVRQDGLLLVRGDTSVAQQLVTSDLVAEETFIVVTGGASARRREDRSTVPSTSSGPRRWRGAIVVRHKVSVDKDERDQVLSFRCEECQTLSIN